MVTVYKGWNAKIYKDGTLVGRCDSVSCDISTGVEPYYEIGSRNPSTLVPGNLEITGSMSKAWVDNTWLELLDSGGNLTHFELVFQAGTVTGSPWVYLYDCLFETGSIDIPQDGILTEDYDFRATSMGLTSAT